MILNNEYNIHTSFAGGNIYSCLRDVWRSYRESIEALDTMQISSDFCVSWYEEDTEHDPNYYFPIKLEERLLNNTKAGNSEEVKKILSLVYRENMENKELNTNMLRLLIYDMRCTIIKVLNHINFKENKSKYLIIIRKVKNLRHCYMFEDAYKAIEDILISICSAIDGLKKSHNSKLINIIKEYIYIKYNDSNFSRYAVASQFKMTEEYLSSFFKEHTGMYFSDFVEEVRMENARELLSNSNTSINDIAQKTGYGSQRAFNRAFKRVNGLTPSDFKKIIDVKINQLNL